MPVVCADDGTSGGMWDLEIRHPYGALGAGEMTITNPSAREWHSLNRKDLRIGESELVWMVRPSYIHPRADDVRRHIAAIAPLAKAQGETNFDRLWDAPHIAEPPEPPVHAARANRDDIVDVTVVDGAIGRHDAMVTSNRAHVLTGRRRHTGDSASSHLTARADFGALSASYLAHSNRASGVSTQGTRRRGSIGHVLPRIERAPARLPEVCAPAPVPRLLTARCSWAVSSQVLSRW